MAVRAASSRDTMNSLLRTVYRDRLREQFNLRNPLLQEIPRENVENFSPGDVISVPLHIAPGSGFAFSKAGLVPAAGHQLVGRATYDYTMLTDRIEVAGDFQQDTSDGAAAETSILDFETKGVVRAGRRGIAFHLYGDGSGKLANVVSAANSTTLVVDTLRGITDNARVDIIRIADGSTQGGVKGATVRTTRGTRTLTLVDDATMADYSDVNTNASLYAVYRQGSRNEACFGLEAWVSGSNPPAAVGNLGNIDRTLAGNDYWRAHEFLNGGVPRECELPLIQDALDAIDEYSEGETKLILCGPRVWNWLAFRLNDQKLFVHEKTTLRGWMSAILFGDMKAPIVKDPRCPPDKMFLLDPSLFRIWQINEGEWMQEDGSVLSRVPGVVAYEATYFRRFQFVCLSPIAQAVIGDLEWTLPSAA